MILELHIVIYIRIFSGQCYVTFPYMYILPCIGPRNVTIPYMERLSFFGRLVQKQLLSCFSDSFVQKTTEQSDGSCNVTSDSQLLYNFAKKQPLHFRKHI